MVNEVDKISRDVYFIRVDRLKKNKNINVK